ncbi:MAG TPA: cohesin domain-containing protein, partial [Acetivibrio sp.]|nr:cohesin domain-containing protein [Acetivibrio sp.]
MKQNKILSLLLTILLVLSCLSINLIYADETPYVEMVLDKTTANLGDVITATIKVNKMPNLGSYQLNIKYDPTVLQAIDVETGEAFEEGTFPKGGTVLVNKAYGVKSAAANEVGSGIINFGSSYLYMSDYKSDGMPEETGIIGKIGFKVLKAQNTQIKFEDTDTMPGAKEGTFFFDWDGKTIVNYEVKQPASITVKSEPTNSYVKMELDKTEVAVGDVITATIEVNEMPNLGSYQLNIKYDPTVLQAIDVETGEAFEEGTFPKGGTVLVNKAYGVKSAAANEVGSGIINFGSSYLYMSDYKSDGMPEETGIIGKIGFKVLKAQNTQIKFEDTDTMPGAKEGTFFFDWDGKTIVNYEVKQPASITAAVVPSPTVIEPTPTPTESETTPTESEVTPTESETTPTESEVTPTESEVTPTESEPTNESYVKIELDKTEVVVGDTIIATVLINKVTNHAGYQFNIKYDPTVLQAVEFDTGEAFLTRTMPTGETIINKSAYEPMTIASNNIREGIINFCSVYSLLDKYREAGQPEETGIAGKIGFKVLKAQDTEILFTDSERMPRAISGTVLTDWYGEVIKDYDVIQPGKIKVYAEPTPTESEATPTESEVTPTESEATPTESEVTPTESEVTPTESEVTPTESEVTPTESEVTPTESEVTPTESEVTPTESEVTPTESEVTPTESEVTPTESEATPTESEVTP